MENEDIIKKYYALSEKQFGEMYAGVKNLVFEKEKSNINRPIAILTGGQPGAGKSSLVSQAKKQINSLGIEPIILDGDIYRGLYPRAIEIAKRYPNLYSEITDKAIGKIIGKLIEETIQGGYTFIREGTLNSAEIVDQLLECDKNYRITIRLLAVCKEESLLSIFERYISMKEFMGIGRLTTIEAHNQRYEQFPKTARIQADKGIEIEVYERGKNVEEPNRIFKSSLQECDNSCFEIFLLEGRKRSYLECKKNARKRLERINKKIHIIDKDNIGILQQLDTLNREMFDITHEKDDIIML